MTAAPSALAALEPCPFCGGSAEPCRGLDFHWVKCTACKAEGPCTEDSQSAAEKWNAARLARDAAQQAGAVDRGEALANVARAMAAKRGELIAKPLASIWPDLAQAAVDALLPALAEGAQKEETNEDFWRRYNHEQQRRIHEKRIASQGAAGADGWRGPAQSLVDQLSDAEKTRRISGQRDLWDNDLVAVYVSSIRLLRKELIAAAPAPPTSDGGER